MITLSIQYIKDMLGTYSIKLGSVKKYIRITDESIVIFSKVKGNIEDDIQEVKDQEIYIISLLYNTDISMTDLAILLERNRSALHKKIKLIIKKLQQ